MNKDDIKKLAKGIKYIVTDIDGVLTDGSLTIDSEGNEAFGKFNIYDGFATVMAKQAGIKIIVISGRKSACTEQRCRKLGIEYTYTGIDDKAMCLSSLVEEHNIDLNECAYIGDDLIDLKVMSMVKFKIVPKNGISDVKQIANYITKARGGEGVLREVMDLILKAQNKYKKIVKSYQ